MRHSRVSGVIKGLACALALSAHLILAQSGKWDLPVPSKLFSGWNDRGPKIGVSNWLKYKIHSESPL